MKMPLQAYAGLNRIEEARATLNAALQHKASAAGFHVELASLDWAEGKDADMEKELQTASATPDGELEVLGFRADSPAPAAKFARRANSRAKRKKPSIACTCKAEPKWKHRLAGFEAFVGNKAEAISEANAALGSSKTLDVQWNGATALALVGQEQKALGIADEIQRTRPNDTIAQNVAVPTIRAIAYLFARAIPAKPIPAKAIDLENTAALYARANTGVLFGRGIAYRQAGRFAEAQQDFEKILQMKPAADPTP